MVLQADGEDRLARAADFGQCASRQVSLPEDNSSGMRGANERLLSSERDNAFARSHTGAVSYGPRHRAGRDAALTDANRAPRIAQIAKGEMPPGDRPPSQAAPVQI
jgi:hypothetical protein